VQKLHLVGFTTELDGLILSARKGSRSGSFVVAIDDGLLEAVVDAVRRREAERDAGDRSLSATAARLAAAAGAHRPRHDSALSVREMQERLRSGLTVEQVADEAGVDVEWVSRFAPPVVAEQARVIDRARGLVFDKARVGPSRLPLGESVARNVGARGVLLGDDELEGGWTAHQVQDDLWAIRFAYVSRGREQEAVWLLDVGDGELTAGNRLASQLGHVATGGRARRPAARRPATPRRKAGARSAAPGTSSASGASGAGDDTAGASRSGARKAGAKKVGRAATKARSKKAGARKAAAARKAGGRTAGARKVGRATKASARRVGPKKTAAKKTAAKKTGRSAKKTAAKKTGRTAKVSAGRAGAKRTAAKKTGRTAKVSAGRAGAKRTAAKKTGRTAKAARRTAARTARLSAPPPRRGPSTGSAAASRRADAERAPAPAWRPTPLRVTVPPRRPAPPPPAPPLEPRPRPPEAAVPAPEPPPRVPTPPPRPVPPPVPPPVVAGTRLVPVPVVGADDGGDGAAVIRAPRVAPPAAPPSSPPGAPAGRPRVRRRERPLRAR
jgi:hypothetical protein